MVIGSQAILDQFPNAPAERLISRQAGIYAPESLQLSEFISGSIGEGSRLERTYAYFAGGTPAPCADTPSANPAKWCSR